MPSRKDLFSCHGESPWLARRTKLKTYASSSPPQLPLPLWPPKREYNAVSAERSMEFGNIIRVETLRYLTKTTTPRRKAGRKSARSKVLAAKHTTSLRRFGEPAYRSEIYFFFKGGKLVVQQAVVEVLL